MTEIAATSSRAVLPRIGQDEHVPTPSDGSFEQFLRGLNPVQQLPELGRMYRAVSESPIAPVLQIAAGGLLGGPIGALSAAAFVALRALTAPTPPSPTEPRATA